MSQELFKVTPVRHYEKPKYYTVNLADLDEPLIKKKPHPIISLIVMMIVFGLSVGLIGCYMRSDFIPEPPDDDGGPDGDPPDPPNCDEGLARCVDEATLELCSDGDWLQQDCETRCNDLYGIDAYSEGCDASADDPCLCQTDIIDGYAPTCTSEDILCVSQSVVERCVDGYPLQTSCEEFCQETFGPDYSSAGCDDSQLDPCQCFYNLIDGGVSQCTDDDTACIDDSSISFCDTETGEIQSASCDDYCLVTQGEGSTSPGCDDSAEDPCQCSATAE